ncbi:hypothetical protein BOTCAL_0708g00020 [Botryotinia calthae]|uniref:Uncharacterized protein n=1 Tax=Botryotinia calthae TaxID=38488 RepID=A0A4Y8CHT3_9HELO|nr:hypothetical protein BOTCAL_0708g00020 [Botryotinia calthae]
MELDTPDVGSDVPELYGLYESAEPPRKKSRGIDDSIIHAHSELVKAYLSIPSRISKSNSEIRTCRELLEGYKAEYIIRQNEANIEDKMRRFGNDEKKFVEGYIKPLIEALKDQPMINCIPENKEVMELYERRHELKEMIESYKKDPNLMEHGQAFLRYFHEKIWQVRRVRVHENIDWCMKDIENSEKLQVDLRIMLVNSGIILKGRGLPMRRIDDSGYSLEDSL